MKAAILSLLTLALLTIHSPPVAFANGGKGQVTSASKTAGVAVNKALRSKRVSHAAVVTSTVTSLEAKSRGRRVDVKCSVQLVAVPTGKSAGKTTLSTQTMTLKGSGKIRSYGRTVAAAKKTCVREVASQLASYKLAPLL